MDKVWESGENFNAPWWNINERWYMEQERSIHVEDNYGLMAGDLLRGSTTRTTSNINEE